VAASGELARRTALASSLKAVTQWRCSFSMLRSLLALSLVLSLLLYKPAPMYILDEVRPT